MSFDFTFTPSRGPSRNECARQALEIVEILGRGHYAAPSGKKVHVADAVRRAVAGTVEHRPDESFASASGSVTTRIRVVNGTSLASARSLAQGGIVPLVLNFASAKNPGGGFLNGARAQEESLARSSALYACIEGRAMYSHHRQLADSMYTSWMIWSPDVPVFRDDESSALLEEPYSCAFLTAPAPNAKVVLDREADRAEEVERVMRERVTRSLAIAATHGHHYLVLGAWGCGVFGNDPAIVADAYQRELSGSFAGVFDEVVFAVLDWSERRENVRPFAERFA
jgi:uncharacterized protein (TIGR02452 family)